MYKLTLDGGVIYLPTGTYIPNNPLNRHWQDYQAWLALGNTPEPADPEPPPSADVVASVGARGWFNENPAANDLFLLSIPELEAEINNLVDVLFPTATAQNKTRTKKFWMAMAVSVRVLAKREFGVIN